jgi:hypothetical protein
MSRTQINLILIEILIIALMLWLRDPIFETFASLPLLVIIFYGALKDRKPSESDSEHLRKSVFIVLSIVLFGIAAVILLTPLITSILRIVFHEGF